ncbi:PucR family transcriptional regulator [Actinomycetospora aeridis]|uniref:Helix-turn-helix domain-containing protein n=1 Tax=Actinomycetospora aeridis TaxID=3129231 RepID=A0ABU8NBQ9_9PSEU
MGSAAARAGVRLTTLRRVEKASGDIAAAGVAAMAERLSWFARLTAEQRSGVLLVTQTGAGNFAAWLRDPDATPRLTAEAFRSAPLDLARRVTLRQTVELVRIAIEVFEESIPPLGADEEERAALVRGVLRFGREVAFSAATVYASAAEARGAWDARLEALVVDAVVRGEAEATLLSRASALGWDPAAEATVVVGEPPAEEPPEPLHAVRRAAHRAGATVLLGTHGARLVMIAGPGAPLEELSASFGPGAVVTGPAVAGLTAAHRSAAAALAGHRAVRAWPGAPRPVAADDLLPERVLDGDARAVEQLRRDVAAPLREAGGELAATVECYLDVAGVLEAAARRLFVHPNTVRYRLRRVAELTGVHPGEARGALVLRLAIGLDRLHPDRPPR